MKNEKIKIFNCYKCNKELKFPEETEYFGMRVTFPEELEGKKVWCRNHFEDLQIYLKQKRQEEVIPQLRLQAETLLADCEKNKKRFIEVIKQTKRFLTSLKKSEPIENFSNQIELNINRENKNEN